MKPRSDGENGWTSANGESWAASTSCRNPPCGSNPETISQDLQFPHAFSRNTAAQMCRPNKIPNLEVRIDPLQLDETAFQLQYPTEIRAFPTLARAMRARLDPNILSNSPRISGKALANQHTSGPAQHSRGDVFSARSRFCWSARYPRSSPQHYQYAAHEERRLGRSPLNPL